MSLKFGSIQRKPMHLQPQGEHANCSNLNPSCYEAIVLTTAPLPQILKCWVTMSTLKHEIFVVLPAQILTFATPTINMSLSHPYCVSQEQLTMWLEQVCHLIGGERLRNSEAGPLSFSQNSSHPGLWSVVSHVTIWALIFWVLWVVGCMDWACSTSKDAPLDLVLGSLEIRSII